MRSKEGDTALNFTSFFGNYELLDHMINIMHADVNIKNNIGQNALHMAAEGDSALSLCFLIKMR